VFPDGGYGVLRSSWEEGGEARWAMFDFGPHGRGGVRLLSLDLAAFGQPLITMPGRYRYHTQDDSRSLFVSTAFQNTVSIDGRNQKINPERALARAKTEGELKVLQAWHDGYSYLLEETGETASGGKIVHERQLVAVRDAFWVVVDLVRIPQGDRGFTFAQNWHFEPTALREWREAGQFLTEFTRGNVLIVPVAGEGSPVVKEGWHSPKYGVRHPAPWLVYQHEGTEEWFLVTLMVPYQGVEPPPIRVIGSREGRSAKFSVEWPNEEKDHLEIGFGDSVGSGRNLWRFTAPGREGREESF